MSTRPEVSAFLISRYRSAEPPKTLIYYFLANRLILLSWRFPEHRTSNTWTQSARFTIHNASYCIFSLRKLIFLARMHLNRNFHPKGSPNEGLKYKDIQTSRQPQIYDPLMLKLAWPQGRKSLNNVAKWQRKDLPWSGKEAVPAALCQIKRKVLQLFLWTWVFLISASSLRTQQASSDPTSRSSKKLLPRSAVGNLLPARAAAWDPAPTLTVSLSPPPPVMISRSCGRTDGRGQEVGSWGCLLYCSGWTILLIPQPAASWIQVSSQAGSRLWATYCHTSPGEKQE